MTKTKPPKYTFVEQDDGSDPTFDGVDAAAMLDEHGIAHGDDDQVVSVTEPSTGRTWVFVNDSMVLDSADVTTPTDLGVAPA